jgi:hypothetical protein
VKKIENLGSLEFLVGTRYINFGWQKMLLSIARWTVSVKAALYLALRLLQCTACTTKKMVLQTAKS